MLERRPGARPQRSPEPVGVVGDQDHGRRVVAAPVRAREAQAEAIAAARERLRRGVQDRADLRLAIPLALDGLGVHAQ